MAHETFAHRVTPAGGYALCAFARDRDDVDASPGSSTLSRGGRMADGGFDRRADDRRAPGAHGAAPHILGPHI
ncbi:hypothetical protein, partial [Rhizobium sp. Leaf341]|uniref:hypothetical protein n=1 Tax=Rhizobium sp. Leaf341 TaxID=1736344 RepID=UPI001AEBFD5A